VARRLAAFQLKRAGWRGDIIVWNVARTMSSRKTRARSTLDIVIYEQDCLTRNLLQEWLSQAGYRVHAGRLRDAGVDRPADLVIVDVYMPKQAGAQCVRDIQAAHPNTPIVAISGQFRYGLHANGATAQTLGATQVIAKPLNRSDLLDTVRGMIGTPG
jgi:DNA-binding response OmpR family regulator